MTPLEAYLDARADFTEASEALRGIAASLKNLARNLELRPGETCFAPFAGEPAPPLDDQMPGRRWSADFLAPATIQAAIRRRLDARIAMHEAWEGVPARLRDGLVPPA